jgi:hypothetical protein
LYGSISQFLILYEHKKIYPIYSSDCYQYSTFNILLYPKLDKYEAISGIGSFKKSIKGSLFKNKAGEIIEVIIVNGLVNFRLKEYVFDKNRQLLFKCIAN